MADYTVKMADTVQVKPAKVPSSVTNVRMEVETSPGVPVTVVENATGVFLVANMLPGQTPGSFRFRSKFYEYGVWGDYHGVFATLDFVASDPPGPSDYEVVPA